MCEWVSVCASVYVHNLCVRMYMWQAWIHPDLYHAVGCTCANLECMAHMSTIKKNWRLTLTRDGQFTLIQAQTGSHLSPFAIVCLLSVQHSNTAWIHPSVCNNTWILSYSTRVHPILHEYSQSFTSCLAQKCNYWEFIAYEYCTGTVVGPPMKNNSLLLVKCPLVCVCARVHMSVSVYRCAFVRAYVLSVHVCACINVDV